MEKFSLICLLLCLFTCCPTANSQDGGICDLVYCGQGNCSSTSTIPFFKCNCFSGWKKIQIGPLTFGSCLLPNCTTNQQCGNAPAPPPPPAALPPPPPNFTDSCNFVWCGEGSCVQDGTKHICECNEGASNLVNNTELPCLKPCSLGADCTNVGLLPPPSPNPSPPSPNSGSNGSPPPSSLNSGGHGLRIMNSSKNVGILIFISLTFIWTGK